MSTSADIFSPVVLNLIQAPLLQVWKSDLHEEKPNTRKINAKSKKHYTCIAEAHEVLNDLNIATLASNEQRRTTLPDDEYK